MDCSTDDRGQFESANDNPAELLKQGWQQHNSDDPQQAHFLFCQSLECAQRQGDERAAADALLALGNNALHYLPDSEDDPFSCRERLANQALDIYRRLDERIGIARSLRQLSSIALAEQARAMLEESLSISRKENDIVEISRCLLVLGNRSAISKNTLASTEYFSEAISLARQSKDKELLADALIMKAPAFEGSNQDRGALYLEACELFRELEWPSAMARCLIACSRLGCREDQYSQREKYLTDALKIIRENNLRDLEALCLNMLADIAQESGDGIKAEQLKQQSHAIEPPIEIPPEFVEMLTEMAESGDEDEIFSFIKNLFF